MLIPKLLIFANHNWLAIGGYVVLLYAASTSRVSAIMFYPVCKLLATMNVPEQHTFGPINHIPFDDRNEHER
tara:strand:- start:70 stop:285 length:216 start_codon:yes stop_codon:yes gene_type:complete